ncbi:MAG: cysteine--tRNA ligase [Alphaproteobacteria bacterium]|nr:MAG: cysteine--tRNA ligase [Alphaproteobacteria bacterium]
MLYLTNAHTREKQHFSPLDPGHVRMYLCGPTVYDRAHIGNARPAVVFDVLYRLLRRSYTVTYARNFTDVDDKIIARAQEQNVSIDTLTHMTIAHYHEDMGALNVLLPTHEPRATQFIPQMIHMIKTLLTKNHAYVAQQHVLFDVTSYPAYGSLSGRDTGEMIAGSRVEVSPYKKNPMDFILWKPSSVDQPGWESPWGRGRPGWHIECSAMAGEILGETFDIHAGGQDLLFPHHENENAQSCCAHGTESYARTWLHNGMLLVNGQKMAKSLGNFFTTRDLLGRLSGEVIRYCLLSAHYRQSLDWTDELIQQATQAIDRLYTALRTCDEIADHEQIDVDVLDALHDDINTPLAFHHLHRLARTINSTKSSTQKSILGRTLVNSARLCGLMFTPTKEWFQGNASLDPETIAAQIAARTEAKKIKDFATADHIRDHLLARGIVLEDTPSGTTWHTKK